MRRNDIIFFSDTFYYHILFVWHYWNIESNVRNSDINALILDYLTMEGYPNAAAKFSKEANLQPQPDFASIQTRQEIQHYIYSGDIQTAIETLNELDPEVCATSLAHLSSIPHD